jgi:hypothetical protein
MEPGFLTLFLEIGAGVAAYGLMVAAFDIAGLRTLILAWLRARLSRA